MFLLAVAERSIRKRAINPKKVHGVDWALGYPLVPEPFIDAGRKLETAVYLHWRRRREDLGYLGEDREIDLVVNPERPEQLINVALNISRSWYTQLRWKTECGLAQGPVGSRLRLSSVARHDFPQMVFLASMRKRPKTWGWWTGCPLFERRSPTLLNDPISPSEFVTVLSTASIQTLVLSAQEAQITSTSALAITCTRL